MKRSPVRWTASFASQWIEPQLASSEAVDVPCERPRCAQGGHLTAVPCWGAVGTRVVGLDGWTVNPGEQAWGAARTRHWVSATA